MNILSINGSPKTDGTCSTVLGRLLGKFESSTNTIEKHHLNSIDIHGCQECFDCRNNKTDICSVQDGLSKILESAKTTDLLVIATPVFYADVSAQLKCFIDRTWSYFGKTGISADHLPRNRTLIFILSYGYMNASVYDQIFDRYKIYFNMFGFSKCFLIKAYGAQWNNQRIVDEAEVMRSIDQICENLK
jgi:multimeric flavodoxin WrbA